MRFLIVGDIVGYNGLKKLETEINDIKEKENIDYIIVNGENSCAGRGIKEKEYKRFINMGCNVITMGNHIYYRKEMANKYKELDKLLIPANVTNLESHKYVIENFNNKKIAVINLIGNVYMGDMFVKNTISPFAIVKDLIKEVKSKGADYIFIDFHAETTAEKIAMSHYLKDDITCLYGTHTHVQTSDEFILDGKIAYITDVGMTGPKGSVLGLKKEIAIERFVTGKFVKYECCNNECFLSSIIVETDDNTNLPISIKRYNR